MTDSIGETVTDDEKYLPDIQSCLETFFAALQSGDYARISDIVGGQLKADLSSAPEKSVIDDTQIMRKTMGTITRIHINTSAFGGEIDNSSEYVTDTVILTDNDVTVFTDLYDEGIRGEYLVMRENKKWLVSSFLLNKPYPWSAKS